MIALKLAAKMKAREPDLRIALTDDHDDRIRARLQAGAGMDRGALHSARLLANHATRLRAHPATPHRARRSGSLAEPDRARAAAQNSPRARQCPTFPALGATLSPVPLVRRPYFQKLDLVCVPEENDIARWQSLGVNRDRIEQVGSIKFDPDDVALRPEIPRAVLRYPGD